MSPDDTGPSPARDRWEDRLHPYLDSQQGVEGLRSRSQPNPPWPEPDNPMFGYLLERAAEIHAEGGVGPAIVWVATHAWFESAVDTRAMLIRRLGS